MRTTGKDHAKEVEERRPLMQTNYGATESAYNIDGSSKFDEATPFAFVESFDGGVEMVPVAVPTVPGVATIRKAAGLDKPKIVSLAPLPGELAPPS
jgi:hypothetical protein